MKLTRQHFQLVADVIRASGALTPKQRVALAEDFAREFARTNSGFQRDRFIRAATEGA